MGVAVKRERDTRNLASEKRALLDHLEERLADRDLSAFGSLDALADRMVATLPDEGAVWGAAIGPVYTSRGLQEWLGITRQAISQHAQNRRILRLTTADGVSVFPSFQFGSNGERLPHLKEVLDTLATGIDDPWIWATWLNTPDNKSRTHAELLRSSDWRSVHEQAREDAAAWSQP